MLRYRIFRLQARYRSRNHQSVCSIFMSDDCTHNVFQGETKMRKKFGGSLGGEWFGGGRRPSCGVVVVVVVVVVGVGGRGGGSQMGLHFDVIVLVWKDRECGGGF